MSLLSGVLQGSHVTPVIPKRGPAIVKLPNGHFFDLWYDRQTRLWVLQLKDADGNQIGPAYGGGAEYTHAREDAVDTIIQHFEAL